jgi:electron transport complex protein RnfB
MAHFIHIECIGCGACKRVCPVEAISGEQKKFHRINPRICIDCGACGIVCPVSCICDQNGTIYQFLKPKERPKAVVDESLCTGCQYCLSICPTGALEIRYSDDSVNKTVYNARPNQCVSCKQCVEVCPSETITMVKPTKDGGEQVA